jgi:o-succinylbenzoate---CoA ligase
MKRLLCPVAKYALSSPHKMAIATEHTAVSYQQFDGLIQRAECFLHSLDLPHKNLAVVAKTTLSTLALYFGALRHGYSVCLLSSKEPETVLNNRIAALKFHRVSFSEESLLPSTPRLAWIPEEYISTYLYTSGSCSEPKIAALSFANHYYSALSMLSMLHLDEKSRYLLSLPLYHVSGLSIVFRTMLSGATLVIPSSQELSFCYVHEKHISHLSLVFTQYIKLLQECHKSLEYGLKAILLGGSSFNNDSLKEGVAHHLPLYLSYGLTEMSSTVCCNPLYQTHLYTSCGFILPYQTLCISSEGEILLGGKTLFQGYYCTDTHQILHHAGLFATQDLATYSLETGLCVKGRKDRLIISGGENIQPEEIEMKLLSIRGIHQAVVLALPDPVFGQKMVAVLNKELLLSFTEIEERLSNTLPRYKIPKHFILWPRHLKSSSLKISHALKAELYEHVVSHECF